MASDLLQCSCASVKDGLWMGRGSNCLTKLQTVLFSFDSKKHASGKKSNLTKSDQAVCYVMKNEWAK